MNQDAPEGPFVDLDRYMALPRLSGLALSPDGTRLVTSVATLDPARTRYVTALWEIDPDGERPARRLTRSAKGEGAPRFLPDGSLVFVSGRPDPQSKDEADVAALWHLPAGGGEARVVAARPGGISGVEVARDEGTVVVASATFPSATGVEEDQRVRTARKDGKIAAILHESYPIRYWDHDLGPDLPRLLSGRVPVEPAAGVEPGVLGQVALTDLTPAAGAALVEAEWAVSPDGSTVYTVWKIGERGGQRDGLVAIDVSTGEHRLLLDDPEAEYGGPVVSPDGLRLAVRVWARSSAHEPPDVTLAVLDLALLQLTPVAVGWDRWPGEVAWSPDGTALFVVADEAGRAPVFRIDLAIDASSAASSATSSAASSGPAAVTRLTGDDGVYSSLQVSPDGRRVYAVRAALDCAPAPVRLAADLPDQQPVLLPAPSTSLPVPGTVTQVEATAEDGTPVRGWLCLPHGASEQNPAPLVVWIHGGPLASANGWSWRWNPWLLVAQGYAVVQPDFALSTGYGREFVRRGWGRWGAEPYTDLMAVTDATVARPDIDDTRTAAMGGSFGGYLANWVAGHTDRFRGIVTHASLWALDQFGPTTDAYDYWRREMTAEMAWANSPHRFVAEIRTPLLVIHGDKDYRVPIGEGLRLWAELAEHTAADDGTMPHKFLYFPDENHWVLTPNHAKLWYATVLAFLATTVHDREWQVPDLLR